MTSLEELREQIESLEAIRPFGFTSLLSLVGRIENEYMELPKVDGIPVHIGDRIDTPEGVNTMVDGFVRPTDAWPHSTPWIRFSGGRQAEPGRCSQSDTWERIEADAEKYDYLVRCGVSMPDEFTSFVRRCKALAGVDDE